MIEIIPLLDRKNKHPIYIQLYSYIKDEIEAGRLPSHTKLPSIRKLASYLQISQNTVESAYQQLLAEGYIDSEPRKGLYIMPIEEKLNVVKRAINSFPLESKSYFEEANYAIDFYQASIDLTHFPISEWKKCSNEVLREKNVLLYGNRQGERNLREQLAKYLYSSRGVNSTPEQIVVGAGIQQLLGVICLIFKQRQQYSVAVENPGYKGAKDVFINHGFNLRPINVEVDGISIENLRKSESNIVYITPSHQYPTGVITPINKRKQLLKWASEADRYIIEDDYDSEFRYVGRPIPSLQGLDSNDKVIYIGTFSKSFLPSVRISYMVLPPEILRIYKKMFTSYSQTVSRIHQEALVLFMERGYLERHIRRIRKLNRQKRDTLLKAIAYHMNDNVTVVGEKSGVYVLLEIKRCISESTLVEQAKNARVKVYPTSSYWTNHCLTGYPMIQLGFGGLTESEIEEGIYLLNKSWF